MTSQGERSFRKFIAAGVATLALVFCLLPATYLLRLKSHESIDASFDSGDPLFLAYKDYQRRYGRNSLVLITLKDKEVFTRSNVESIFEATKRLESLVGVDSVLSLTSVTLPFAEEDRTDFRTVIPEEGVKETDLPDIKKEFLAHPMLVGKLIAKDAGTTTIMAELSKQLDAVKEAELVGQIEKEARKALGSVRDLYFMGNPIIDKELDGLLDHDRVLLVGIMIVLSFVVLSQVTRSTKKAGLILGTALLSLLWTTFCFVFNGEAMGVAALLIAPCVLLSSIALGVLCLTPHPVKEPTPSTKFKSPKWLAVLVLVTGYAALALCPILPLSKLGSYCLLGTLISLAFFQGLIGLFSFLKLDATRILAPPRPRSGAARPSLRKNAHPLWSLAALSLLVGGGVALSRLTTDANPIHYLRETSKVTQSIQFNESHLSGLFPIEYELSALEGDFSRPEMMQKVDAWQKLVKERMGARISSSLSILDYLKEMNRAFDQEVKDAIHLPRTAAELSDALELMGLSDEKNLARFIAPDRKSLKMSFNGRIKDHNLSHDIDVLLDGEARALLGGSISWQKVGLARLLEGLDMRVRKVHWAVLATVILLNILLLAAIKRSFAFACVGAAVNLLPIAATFILMHMAGIAINVITLAIGPLSFGFLTIMSLSLIGDLRRVGNHTICQFNFSTFRTLTLVLALGFAVLAVSALPPIAQVGIAVAANITVGALCQLALLPTPLRRIWKVRPPAERSSHLTAPHEDEATIKAA